MKILKNASGQIYTASSKPMIAPIVGMANCWSGGITRLRSINGGNIDVDANDFCMWCGSYGFTATTIPKKILTNTATEYSFSYINAQAPTSVTVTFLNGKSSIASASTPVIGSGVFSFNITCTAEDTVSFTVTAIFGTGKIQETTYSFTAYNVMPTPTYSVEAIEGASYGFALNSDNYYESQNKGVDSSYAICKITFNAYDYNMYLDCINYAEANYDYGLLSELNTTLSLSSSADTTGVFKNFKGSSSASIQVVDYGVIATGSNYITVKFIKDGSTGSNNDSLQFKIRFE